MMADRHNGNKNMTAQQEQRTIATVRSSRDIDRLKMVATDRVRRGDSPPLYHQQSAAGEETSVDRHKFFQALARHLDESGEASVQIEGRGRRFLFRIPAGQHKAPAHLRQAA